MFLIVFVTLVVSVIGLYAQVLSLQAAQAHNAQVGLMQTMMTWHGAVTDFAISSTDLGSVGATGCSLTQGPGSTVNYIPACPEVLTSSTAALLLPAGYNFTNFAFASAAFRTGAQLYVVTYVHDTNSPTYSTPYGDPSQDLMLPGQGGTEVGYSLNDLRQQFERAAPMYLTYGTVTSLGMLTVKANYTIGGTSYNAMQYTVPSTIPVNSLAIISVAQ